MQAPASRAARGFHNNVDFEVVPTMAYLALSLP
jgi:hypothetical protein